MAIAMTRGVRLAKTRGSSRGILVYSQRRRKNLFRTLGSELNIFGKLFESTRRKRLAQVAIAYAAGAWALAQLAALVLDAFKSPDWVMQAILALLVSGMPLVMAGAWIMGRADAGSAEDVSNRQLDDIRPGETQYVRSGGASIAFQVTGSGPVDIVLVNGWVSNVELVWEHPIPRHFTQRLASNARLINFDKRGTGLSDRGGDLPTFEQRMDDVRAVMDAAGSERAVLFGYSEGGPMSALFAATYPERTLGLVLYGTYMKRVRSDDYPWAPTREERLESIEKVEKTWGTAVDVEYYAPSIVGDAEFVDWLTSYWRRSASPRDAAELLRMNTDIDACHILPSIRVPTLVLHRSGDKDAQVAEGRYIAERIPNASFIELPGSDHLPWTGNVEDILRPIENFIADIDNPFEPDTVLATLVAVKHELSVDAKDAYRTFTATVVERFRGQLSAADGPSTLIGFDGTGRAIRCALAILDYCKAQDLPCQIGVHVGECRRNDDSLSGFPVSVSRAVADNTAVGEIMVTQMVRDLVTGFVFDDGRVTDLDGVDGEWRLSILRD